MKWYVCKRLDSPEEFYERVKFYENLIGLSMRVKEDLPDYFEFDDGRKDNRCMIIGHTNTAMDVMALLKNNSTKKYKIYLSVCEMYADVFEKLRKYTNYEIYATGQEKIAIGGKRYFACEFLNKSETKLGFKATRSELNMYCSKLKGFYNKLEKSFIRF